MSSIEIETTIKSGLPIIAIMEYQPAEPDLGYFTESIEEPRILWLSGREVTLAVYNSIPKSDINRIMVEGLDSVHISLEDYI